jgi:hypothetical protein
LERLKFSERQKVLAQQKAVQLIQLGVRFDEKTDEDGIELCVRIPPPETPAAAPDNKE